MFTSASPSASFPATGSLVLNHCSARRLPGAGFMPPSVPRLDGDPKAVCKPPPAFLFFSFFFSSLFFFDPSEPASAATLLSPPPFWLRNYLGSGNMFRHLVAGSAGLWQRLAACSSPIGKGRRARPSRCGSTRPTLASGDVPVAACTAPAWPVALSSLAPAAIPLPARLWLCLEFWPRPTSGFAGRGVGFVRQKSTALYSIARELRFKRCI